MSTDVLAPEAYDAIKLIREMRTLDEVGIRTVQQLFTNRLNDDLIATVVLGKEDTLAVSLFKVATATHSPAVVGYVLRFVADLCQVCPSLSKALADPAAESALGADPAVAFMLMVSTHSKDAGIVNPALFLAASVLRFSPAGIRSGSIAKFIAHCTTVLGSQSVTANDVEFVIHAVSVFVRRKELRTEFQQANLVEQIPRLLSQVCAGDSAQIVQLTYETLLTIWVLSFDYQCIVSLYNSKVIPTVHRVLQRVQKEKCVRMAVMILLNMCNAQRKYYNATTSNEWAESTIYVLGGVGRGKGPTFYADMIGIGMMKTLWQLIRRKYGDEDIPKALEDLTNTLESNIDSLTSFSEYKGEVESGVLEWSPVHSSTKFWKENASKFEENQYEVLKELGELIATSRNDVTLAVACHDIGELVRYHPSGRLLLNTPQVSGVKEKVMQLMSHSNPDVAKNALLAVQKIMVQKWDFIK